MPLPPPRTTTTTGITPLRQTDHLLNTRRLLLLLQRRNLLTAIPPLLFAEFKGLGFDLFDREGLGLDVLPSEADHENFLPLGCCADKEFATTLKRLFCVSDWVDSGWMGVWLTLGWGRPSSTDVAVVSVSSSSEVVEGVGASEEASDETSDTSSVCFFLRLLAVCSC